MSEIINRKPGTKLKVDYVRSGKPETASVTVADREKLFPESPEQAENANEQGAPAESKLGVTVRGVTPEMADRLSIPANKGVIVTGVKPGSFADDVNLTQGDVILEINRQPVNSEEEFRKIQTQLKSGQDVVFLVRQGRGRTAGTVFLGGTLP